MFLLNFVQDIFEMISTKASIACIFLLLIQVQCFPHNFNRSDNFKVQRTVRGIKDWKIFAKPTTEGPPTTTTTEKAQNHLEIGQCEDDDKVN